MKLSGPKQISTTQLSERDVLVKLKAASLNYRDLMIARGLYSKRVKSNVVPSSDGAGIVVAVGSGVQDFKVGDKVVTIMLPDHQFGALTPKATTNRLGGSTALVSIPKNLNFEQAATLSCSALTSWNALFGMKPLKPGEYVLVQGTGGVSIAALQFAKATGVVATTSSDAKAKKLLQLGANHVINYKATPEWGPVARALTPDNSGFDHIIEVGGPLTIVQSLKAIKFEGIISVIGFIGGDRNAHTAMPLSALDHCCIIRGFTVGSRQQMKEMVAAIEVNNIVPVLDERVFSFEEVPEAYEYMWAQKHFSMRSTRIRPV
ncbi:hypothetical protein BDZ91DRAFT_777864 [Kalaharituber pfeilii]|nr:hypothetical protein BDZ91DRAFT_777864 [Kalaharituber pfeilii]